MRCLDAGSTLARKNNGMIDKTDIEAKAIKDARRFSPIGINCHLCPRKACGQRAHRPLLVELPIDTSRRGSTRYES